MSVSTGFRVFPDNQLFLQVIGAFIKDANLNHITEVHLNHCNQADVISAITELYPELHLYYYPSKLTQNLEKDPETGEMKLTFNGCVKILRQVARGSGRRVLSKSVTRSTGTEYMTIIYPLPDPSVSSPRSSPSHSSTPRSSPDFTKS